MAKKIPQSMMEGIAAVQDAASRGETIVPERDFAVQPAEGSVNLNAPAFDEPEPKPAPDPVPEPERAAPDPQPAPEKRAAAEDDDDDEPDEKGEHGQGEPDWMKALPAEQADYIRGLRGRATGAHAKAQRRAERIKALTLESQQAIQMALAARDEARILRDQQRPKGEAAPGAAPLVRDGKVVGELDEDGKPVVPVDAILAEIERRQAPQRAALERGQMADQMLNEGGVSPATQTRLLGAVRRMSELYREAVTEAGLAGRPLSASQELKLLRDSGAAEALAQEFGGVEVEDLYDMVEGASAPEVLGRHMVRAARRYEELWTKPAAPPAPAKPNTAQPVREHPTSMARKGEPAYNGDKSATQHLSSLRFEDALKMTPDQMDELEARWRSEHGGQQGATFTRQLGVR